MRRGRKADPNRQVLGEIKFPPSSIVAPDHLAGYALKHWNELAPMLIATGRLTVADRSAFEQLCLDFAIIQQAKEGGPITRMIKHARQTSFREDSNEVHAARKRYARWLIEFGLTPQSRPRLGKPAKATTDRLGDFWTQRS
jgi:P27 family predicted phage terminase small subunit